MQQDSDWLQGCQMLDRKYGKCLSNSVVLNRGGRQEISRGTANPTCSTTYKIFERECVPFKDHASANFTALYVIWFSSGRDLSILKFCRPNSSLHANIQECN